MRNILILLLGILIVVGALVYGRTVRESTPEPAGDVIATYLNQEHGFSFEYLDGPGGYTAIENENAVSLMLTREYEEAKASEVAREWPPAIIIQVFENPNGLSARAWVETEKRLSNYDVMLEPMTDLFFSGKPAVKYKRDGLYASDVVIFANDSKIYKATGNIVDESHPISKDFLPLLESLIFF